MSSGQHNYIDLKVNGRLFPTWVMHNFKKYRLPPIVHSKGEDPCHAKGERGLRMYQQFLASYLDYHSPYRDILVYHGLGSGKTVSAINVYNVLYNYTPQWNVFVLIKASLKDDPWLKDLKAWLPNDEREERMANIRFVHYDAPNADKAFLNAVKDSDANKKNIYIIDEAHNFIKNVYNNIVTGYGKRAHVIYDYIITDKKENNSSRVVLLSGTPAVNTPYELALIFNLLRPDSFPKTEAKFNEIYISGKDRSPILNPDTKNMFQRRILGLVSYYIGADPQLFASKTNQMKYLHMDPYQKKVYEYYEQIEEALEKKRAMTGSQTSVYRAYTRQASNFVFPVMGDDFSGENRPRPNKFNLSMEDSVNIVRGKMQKLMQKDEEAQKKKENVNAYNQAMQSYIDRFDAYLDAIHRQDVEKGHTLDQDIEAFKTKYSMKFVDFWTKHEPKSGLLKAMYACSCKMTAIPFYMMRSKGPVLVYSNYVRMEGIQIFKIYLKHFGFGDHSQAAQATQAAQAKHRFVEYHGEVDQDVRTKNLRAFNDPKNKHGDLIRAILISPAGSEGINLLNVRQVHVMEPYWNEVRIKQLIGRAIRMCSHKDLPMEERNVVIYRYHATRGQDKAPTTDEEIFDLASKKETLIESFLKTVREVAVDCELFKNHNMIDEPYDCFKFNEKALFAKFIGPAFKDYLPLDRKVDNGLNSRTSVKKQVKVYKIKAVTQNEGKTSEPKDYWYNPDTGVVYDLDMDYPVGRVLFDKSGLPHKLDTGDVYLLEEVIPIPKLSRV
jgi:SNF2 family DNA or RNA helicase